MATLTSTHYASVLQRLDVAETNAKANVEKYLDGFVEDIQFYYMQTGASEMQLARAWPVTMKEAQTHPLFMSWLQERLTFPWAAVRLSDDKVLVFPRKRFGAVFLHRLLHRRNIHCSPTLPLPQADKVVSHPDLYAFSGTATQEAMKVIEDLENQLLNNTDIRCFTAEDTWKVPILFAHQAKEISACIEVTVQAPWQVKSELHVLYPNMLVCKVSLDPTLCSQLAP